MITVTLTDEQTVYCEKIARLRQASAERHNRPGTNGSPERGDAALQNHIHGALAEGAAFLWLKLKLSEWQRYQEHDIKGSADLADFIDVKAVQSSRHRMIVQKDCPDERAYLLVNGERHPVYEIVGWLWGREAKLPKYLRDPVGGREAFFVPRRDLRPPESLRHLVGSSVSCPR